jgi:CubicO group peptidase (beta-lactamase class C family)
MPRPITLLLGLMLTTPCLAQESSPGDHPRVQEALHLLEVWVDAQRAYEQIPGASMAVVHDQELLWSKGFGHADRERQSPATPQTMYSICSISKLFTSVGIMQLRDQGRLRLDDPVGDHLSWFNIQDTYPDAPPVTIEGILTHSSGLPRESDYPYWSAPDFSFPTHDQIVKRLPDQKELYPAATWYQYSNLGLTLAGEIVGTLSGEAYDTYIRHNILDPLGMDDTNPEMPPGEYGRRLASGYTAITRDGTREKVAEWAPRAVAPAMGFASTVEDLAKFASWQFRVLTFVGHGGSCPGYRSQFTLQVDDKIATIFMSNASGVNAGRFTQRGQEIMAPALAAADGDADKAKQLDPAFEKYLGTYSQLPWGGESAVIPWKGKLSVVYLPTSDPLDAMMHLEHVEGDTFRRKRDDGSLGEEIRFDVDDTGRVIRMWRHSNFSPKVR